ncbi:MAG: type II toxin-antitoxin system VapC family toxin [Xanthomonadales bacterium]|nr:type II toxin-antitoxin system VapC family toxin [Xanthomonadales bacterium]MBK7146192.1 type II toxin-antitoxin system VapC family toxin [Xanthomonadales bacterium]MCC6561335.1 type II toxin-antitoxin system VapC family toxin [Xanthomonadales bacterium]
MKLSVDTNVLVRSVVRDDARQARAAEKALTEAALIAVSLPCLCEFVWVLRKVYRFADAEIAAAIRALAAAEKVAMNRSAVEAGLALLEAGGDFADAIIAHEGQWLGAEVFVSFDQQAVSLLNRQGQAARLP